MGENDPRVYFAAERTLLAWLRTAITVIGLGFVVARFGLFLNIVSAAHGTHYHPGASTAIGVGLILLGSLAAVFAAIQHTRYSRTLPVSDRPASYATGFATVAAFVLAAIGVVLAVYLVSAG
jgi:putative membrane protein